MSTCFSYSFRRLLVAFAILTVATVASGADLSGVYADTGTAITSAGGRPLKEPSLHALFRLEFDPRLAAIRTEQTAHVKVTHEGEMLEVTAYNLEGEVSWRGWWREGEGYVRREDRLILRFRAGASESGEVVLTLESVTEHGLLQITAQRLTPTMLGPMAETIGVFLFHRMP